MPVEIYPLGKAAIPTGGTAGQVLVKVSTDPFDIGWGTVSNGTGTVGGSYVTDDELAAAMEDALEQYVTASQLTNALAAKQNTGDYVTTTALIASEERVRDRSYHTGTQSTATMPDLAEFIRDTIAAFLSQGTNITLTHDDAGDKLTVAGAGAGSLDAEAVRDAIGVAMVGLGNISVVPNDVADTITITTTATVNSTDAALRDRSTHTGMAPLSSISGITDFGEDVITAPTQADARGLLGAMAADAVIPQSQVSGLADRFAQTPIFIDVASEAAWAALPTKNANALYGWA